MVWLNDGYSSQHSLGSILISEMGVYMPTLNNHELTVTLTVEGVVDLRILKCKYSLTLSNFLIVQVHGGRREY